MVQGGFGGSWWWCILGFGCSRADGLSHSGNPLRTGWIRGAVRAMGAQVSLTYSEMARKVQILCGESLGTEPGVVLSHGGVFAGRVRVVVTLGTAQKRGIAPMRARRTLNRIKDHLKEEFRCTLQVQSDTTYSLLVEES